MRLPRATAVPVGVLLALAGGVALLTFTGSYSLMQWAYADWVAVSGTSREALVYAAPFSAGLAAWVAGRYLRPRSVMCPPSSARSGMPVVVAQLRLLCAAALIGWCAGLVPLLVFTASRATYGGPDVLVILGSAAVLVSFVTSGYLIGCVAPRAVSIIASVTLAFTAILLVDTWGLAVAPLRLATPAAGQYETGALAAFRVLFFLVLSIFVVASAARIVLDRSTSRDASAFAGLLLLVPPLILGGVAKATAPVSVAREAGTVPRCAMTHHIRVCVHPAKSVLLEPLTQTVDQVLRSVDYAPALPVTAVIDGSLRSSTSVSGRAGITFLDLQTDPGYDWRSWAAGDLALYLSGGVSCRRGDIYGDQVGPALDKSDVSEAFARWIARSAGYDTPQIGSRDSSGVTEKLTSLPPEKIRALYHQYSSQIAACELPSSAIK